MSARPVDTVHHPRLTTSELDRICDGLALLGGCYSLATVGDVSPEFLQLMLDGMVGVTELRERLHAMVVEDRA